MPLLDHFRPPLGQRRHWHSFHNSWPTYLAADLNRQLPPDYFAEANVQFGIEIDVAAFEEPGHECGGFNGWIPPAPTATSPYPVKTDQVEVQIFGQEGGPRLAGAIEFVSPANKDRAHRDAFVSKCVTLLTQGIGLVVVDVVTDRHANLHAELTARLDSPSALTSDLFATAYRRAERDGELKLDLWEEELAVGRLLPSVPLWLPGDVCLQVALEETYQRTCAEQRVSLSGPQG